MVFCVSLFYSNRSSIASHKERAQSRSNSRGEAPSNGLHVRAAGASQERIRREPIFERETPPRVGQRAAVARESDQDLVPKQKSQDQEDDRPKEPVGLAADGSGSLQPLDCADRRRRRRGRVLRS